MRGSWGGKPVWCAEPAVLLLAIFLLVPSAAFGSAADFLPTIYSSGGSFEMRISGENNENTVGGRGVKSSDTFATEYLRFYLDGFLYHPRFIIFTAKGNAGMSQERYDNSQAGYSINENALVNDYELRTKILPEHPYNLEMYTLSSTPLLRRSSADTRSTNTEEGVIFNYAKKPFFLNLSHTAGAFITHVSRSDYRTERANGTYIIGPVSNTAAYTHTNTSTSFNTYVSTDLASFENIISKNDVSLSSQVSNRTTKQTSPFSAGLDYDWFTWTEQFNAALPWHFSTAARYDVRKNSLITAETALKPRSEETTKTTNSSFTLSHKLYDSVRTSYTMNESTAETSRGNTMSMAHSVSGMYTKRIPDGRLTIGAHGNRTFIDQNNAPLFMGESHSTALFGTFEIARENIDVTTISISVLDDSGALVGLTENVNYIIQPSGNVVQIMIIMLPAVISSGNPIGYEYTFHATYTLLASTVEFETTSAGYMVNLSLFNNLLAPYFGRTSTYQEILAGSIPGGPRDTTSTVLGIMIRKAPYVFVTEERTYQSPYNPFRSLKNTAQYTQRMSETMNMSLKGEHTNTVYGSGMFGTKGYDETITSFFLSLIKHVPSRKLDASLNTNYSQMHSIINTRLYGITGLLSWKLGVLSMDLGATISSSESTGAYENQTMLSELYFFNLSRKLF